MYAHDSAHQELTTQKSRCNWCERFAVYTFAVRGIGRVQKCLFVKLSDQQRHHHTLSTGPPTIFFALCCYLCWSPTLAMHARCRPSSSPRALDIIRRLRATLPNAFWKQAFVVTFNDSMIMSRWQHQLHLSVTYTKLHTCINRDLQRCWFLASAAALQRRFSPSSRNS